VRAVRGSFLEPTPKGGVMSKSEEAKKLRACEEALESVLRWAIEAEVELGRPLRLKYRANIQKPVVFEKVRAALALVNPTAEREIQKQYMKT
jgi:hypothetical protein